MCKPTRSRKGDFNEQTVQCALLHDTKFHSILDALRNGEILSIFFSFCFLYHFVFHIAVV